MNRSIVRSLPLVAVAFVLAAALAHAATEAQLTAQATALRADYVDLHERVVEDVEPHEDLEAEYAALEVERAALVRDRATLPPACTCTTLDSLIGSIADISDAIAVNIGNWHES